MAKKKEKKAAEKEKAEKQNSEVIKETEETPAEKSEEKSSEEQIQDLQEEVNELNDKLVRRIAEFDNYRRRTAQEYQQLIKTAGEGLIREFLPVLDNFERALSKENKQSETQTFITGMEMIYKHFKESMDKQGLKPMETVGQAFDPKFHEAMIQMNSDEYEEGIICQEVERGYLLDNKCLRPAKVFVSKGNAEEPKKTEEKGDGAEGQKPERRTVS